MAIVGFWEQCILCTCSASNAGNISLMALYMDTRLSHRLRLMWLKKQLRIVIYCCINHTNKKVANN